MMVISLPAAMAAVLFKVYSLVKGYWVLWVLVLNALPTSELIMPGAKEIAKASSRPKAALREGQGMGA